MKYIANLVIILALWFPSAIAIAEEIKVLDWQSLHDPKQRPALVAELKQSLTTSGFVAFKNVPLQKSHLSAAYDDIGKFFNLPVTEKLKVHSKTNSGERGYVMSESAQSQAMQKKDYKEFIHVGREFNDKAVEASLGYPDNIWPKAFNLRDPVMTFYNDMDELSFRVADLISEALDLNPRIFRNLLDKGDHLLRAIHYPKNPPKHEEWAASHTDISFFTILPRASAEGLQVQASDGSWVDVVIPQDCTIIVNVGDMLQNITNGLLKSAVHRVIAKHDDYDRYAIVFFVHAHNDDDMSPLPEMIQANGGVQKFPNAKRQYLLYDRIVSLGRASDAMVAELAESGLPDEMIKYQQADPKVLQTIKERGYASPVVLQALQAKG